MAAMLADGGRFFKSMHPENRTFPSQLTVAIETDSCVQSGRFCRGVSMRYLALSILLLLPINTYAGNIKDTDLISSNTFFLPPSTQKTVFIQARNSSDNQGVSFHDLGPRLAAKGYQVVNDPDGAHYIVLANIVYCNITKPEMPVESMVASGYGSAFNTTMGAMQGLTSMASMAGPYGAIGGAAASMGLSAIQGIGDLFSSSNSAPKMPDDVNYACVADIQITEQKTEQLPSGMKTGSGQEAGVYQTRLAADVHQKKLDEAEATPLLQQKLSAAVAGNF
ncbi:MAG: complement resistance protein TraT [Nitrospiraceae bacterium]